MNNLQRIGLVGLAAAMGAVLVPSATAGAATAGHDEPKTKIVVCNRSGYLFNVYADGPSVREDDLAGLSKSGECTDWEPVLPGGYDIGFGLKTASSQRVIIQARFKRHGHVYYKSFNNEGVIKTFVAPGETVTVDLLIPQG
jgi:hypothetical protein